MTDFDGVMIRVRQWLDMSCESAKTSINQFMESEGFYSELDFKLLECSESAEEAIGVLFGI